MRVLIVNQHTQNFGDEAAGVALIELLLASPSVDSIDILYNGPGGLPISDRRVRRVEGAELREMGYLNLVMLLAFRRFRGIGPKGSAVRSFLDCARGADVVLVAPSGANIGVYRDWRFLFRLLFVVRCGAHPVFHWNTVGASGSRLFDRVALKVLAASRLYVRERASAEYLQSIGLESTVGPDTAFALSPSVAAVNGRLISVVPSELDSWHPAFRARGANETVLGPIAQIIAEFAEEHGLFVQVLPHLGSELEARFNRAFCDRMRAAGLRADHLELVGSLESFNEYDDALSRSRLVVGGRYHTVVLAAKNFRPFVALSYENKMNEVCHYTGMEEYCIDLYNGGTGERLSSALERALADEHSISSKLRRVVTEELRPAVKSPLRDLGLLDAHV